MKDKNYTALGLIFGTVLGVLTDNIGLWLSLGIAIGVGLDRKLKKDKVEQDDHA